MFHLHSLSLVDLFSLRLQVYVQVNREAESDESVRSAAAEFYRRLVQREDQALELWRQFREITVDEYKRIYQVISVYSHFKQVLKWPMSSAFDWISDIDSFEHILDYILSFFS